MKVIIVRSSSINPDPRVIKEATTLSKAGYTVDIFCWGRDNSLPAKEETSSYIIYRFLFKAPLGKKVMYYLPFWWLYETFWLLVHKWDIVHAVDYDTIIPAIIVGKLKHKKIVYDICDYFPDRGEIPIPISKLLRLSDKLFLSIVNAVILIDDCKFEEIGNINNTNVCVLYNSPDVTVINNINNDNTSLPFIETEHLIFYGGSISKYRDIKSMIDIVADYSNCTLLIAGYGNPDDVNEIQSLCDKHANTSFIGKITHDNILKYTQNADLIYILYDPSILNNRYASPTKMFEAMMCGTPVITNGEISSAKIIEDTESGLIVPYGDYSALRSSVLLLINNPDLRVKLGLNGKRAFDEKYRWNIMEKRLVKTYNSMKI